MALSTKVVKVITLYFNVVPPDTIGVRLQQVWDALQQAQRDQIKLLIKNLYYRMFTLNRDVSLDPIMAIINIEPILTGVQKQQIFTLMKNDIIAQYAEDKDDIDDDISDVTGTDI